MAQESGETSEIIQPSLIKSAFNSENAMILVGQAHLNKISQYLANLPDKAKVKLLVSPKDTAAIFKRGLGTWLEEVQAIRSIDETHGLHFDDQALTGMKVFDKYEEGHDNPIEKEIADQLREVWAKVLRTSQGVTTDLFMGTKQIVDGREIGSDVITVRDNLYSRKEKIAEQGGQFVTEESEFVQASCQLSSTEAQAKPSKIYIVDFAHACATFSHSKNDHGFPSCPVALHVFALDS